MHSEEHACEGTQASWSSVISGQSHLTGIQRLGRGCCPAWGTRSPRSSGDAPTTHQCGLLTWTTGCRTPLPNPHRGMGALTHGLDLAGAIHCWVQPGGVFWRAEQSHCVGSPVTRHGCTKRWGQGFILTSVGRGSQSDVCRLFKAQEHGGTWAWDHMATAPPEPLLGSLHMGGRVLVIHPHSTVS